MDFALDIWNWLNIWHPRKRFDPVMYEWLKFKFNKRRKFYSVKSQILEQQIVPCKSATKEVTIEWSHLTTGFHPHTRKHEAPCIQHNKQYHTVSSFHLNGHTIGFHPQTQKLEPHYTAYNEYHRKVLLSSRLSYKWSYHRISSTGLELEEPLYVLIFESGSERSC